MLEYYLLHDKYAKISGLYIASMEQIYRLLPVAIIQDVQRECE